MKDYFVITDNGDKELFSIYFYRTKDTFYGDWFYLSIIFRLNVKPAVN